MKYIKAPYHKNLAPRFNHVFKDYNRKMAYYNTKTTARFFGKVKDKTDNMKKTEVIYQLECNCGKNYIGQTKQYVKTRLEQHKKDIDKGLSRTGLSAHICNNKDHKIDWDNVRILDTVSRDNTRLFYEMYHILSNENTLNIQSDFNGFNNIYNNIIKKFK